MDSGQHSKFGSVVIGTPVWCDHGLVRVEVEVSNLVGIAYD